MPIFNEDDRKILDNLTGMEGGKFWAEPAIARCLLALEQAVENAGKPFVLTFQPGEVTGAQMQVVSCALACAERAEGQVKELVAERDVLVASLEITEARNKVLVEALQRIDRGIIARELGLSCLDRKEVRAIAKAALAQVRKGGKKE